MNSISLYKLINYRLFEVIVFMDVFKLFRLNFFVHFLIFSKQNVVYIEILRDLHKLKLKHTSTIQLVKST